ncbi:unnamed protein product [Spirodela intermedia]|uniref:Uncharacterized protein n=1 Tax=Spirodela intermedia TaxID=51605 RepID=A0ABN7EDQ2_SPIIN|nr:unnamed protein product [Spirodela intermedia]
MIFDELSPAMAVSNSMICHFSHSLLNSVVSFCFLDDSPFRRFFHLPSRRRVRRASPGFDVFPSVCSDVVVREARLEDCWQVAETHCSSFFPNYTFPLDLASYVVHFLLAS